jgi:DNA ligase (NAD+)
MTDSELIQHIKDLRDQINFHNYRYHSLDDPIISDFEFDRLVAELRDLESQNPEPCQWFWLTGCPGLVRTHPKIG